MRHDGLLCVHWVSVCWRVADDHDRRVVVDVPASQRSHDTLDDGGGFGRPGDDGLELREQSRRPEHLAVFRQFRQPIGVQKQNIAGFEFQRAIFEQRRDVVHDADPYPLVSMRSTR